jgi:hypothetical protein
MQDATSREHFRRHGWMHLPKFLSADDTRQLARWTDEITAWPEEPGTWMRYYEKRPAGDGKMLARIENFVPYHDGLAALLTRGRTLDLLSECCGEPVLLFKDKINFKYPGGAAFTPHQDYPAYVNFGVGHHLTLMAPVDPFTLENGRSYRRTPTAPSARRSSTGFARRRSSPGRATSSSSTRGFRTGRARTSRRPRGAPTT